MRLIDADALPIVTRGKNHHRKYVFADITDAPTIDAIPVEWMRRIADDDLVTPPYRFYAQAFINIWAQEKEAR